MGMRYLHQCRLQRVVLSLYPKRAMLDMRDNAGERAAACRGGLLVALRRLFFFCLGGTRTMLACRVRLETFARMLRCL